MRATCFSESGSDTTSCPGNVRRAAAVQEAVLLENLRAVNACLGVCWMERPWMRHSTLESVASTEIAMPILDAVAMHLRWTP